MSAQSQKNEFDEYWNKIMNLAGKKVDELYPDAVDDGVCEWLKLNEELFNGEKKLYDRLGELRDKDLEAFKKAAVDYAQFHVRIFNGYSEWKKAAQRGGTNELAG